jgi:hypothetical protein
MNVDETNCIPSWMHLQLVDHVKAEQSTANSFDMRNHLDKDNQTLLFRQDSGAVDRVDSIESVYSRVLCELERKLSRFGRILARIARNNTVELLVMRQHIISAFIKTRGRTK